MTYFDQLFEIMPNGSYRERKSPAMAQVKHVAYIQSLVAQTRFDRTGSYYTPKQQDWLLYESNWENGSEKKVPNYSHCIRNAWIPQSQVGNRPAFF